MKKFIVSILLLGLAAVSFYFSLFWGWASGAVSPSEVGWSAWYKNASNMAFGFSALCAASTVAMWLAPFFRKKKNTGKRA